MLKVKYDFNCILVDVKTGKQVDKFTAQQVTDENYSAGFVGGNLASASKAMTLMTEKKLPFVPLRYKVIIDGEEWILASFVPAFRRKLGANKWNKPKPVYILNLE